jgi:hypothetical protein
VKLWPHSKLYLRFKRKQYGSKRNKYIGINQEIDQPQNVLIVVLQGTLFDKLLPCLNNQIAI